MKILFWVPYPTEGPSNRYRIEQYFPYLKEAGYDYVLRSFWTSTSYKILYKKGYFFKKTGYFFWGSLRRLWDIVVIYQYDLVFIHREAYPVGGAFFENILSIIGKSYIFDFDDAIFSPSVSRQNSFMERFKDTQKTRQIIKNSCCVIAGNRYLADYSLRYNANTRIIPTVIDTKKYPLLLTYAKKPKITIGWMGSVTTLEFLEDLKRVFVKISKEFSNVAFQVVGGYFSVEGLTNVSSKDWLIEEEIDNLRSFDIGIMPVPDNEWTRGKCGFKAILYMSAGIPCVCSPVGVNREIVRDGVNGYLAETEEEWVSKLSFLIKDASLREKIGRQARKTVEENYSVSVTVPKFLEVFRNCYKVKKTG